MKYCNTCNSKIRRLRNKIKAIYYKGNKCEICGLEATKNNYAIYQFHHIENNKDYNIGQHFNRTWEFIKKEIDKCQLVCSNCHHIIHCDYDNIKLLEQI